MLQFTCVYCAHGRVHNPCSWTNFCLEKAQLHSEDLVHWKKSLEAVTGSFLSLFFFEFPFVHPNAAGFQPPSFFFWPGMILFPDEIGSKHYEWGYYIVYILSMNIHIDIHVSTKYYCISWRFFPPFHSPSNFVTFYMAWRVGCKTISLVFFRGKRSMGMKVYLKMRGTSRHPFGCFRK